MPEITLGKWGRDEANPAHPGSLRESEGLELIAGGFSAAEINPACIRFTLHDGRTLTYWRDSYEVGDAWVIEDA